jgi:nicotinamidase-related amidase
MKSWLPVLVLALLAGCATAPKAPVALGHHPVLIVLDLQQDYFGPEAKMPVASAQTAGVLVTCKALVRAFKAAGRPIVYLQNEFSATDWIANWFRHGATVEGTPGTQWIGPTEAPDLWQAKRQADAFTEPAVDDYLRSIGADSVVIAGVFADPMACVPSTAAGARRRGYGVTIPYDAVGTSTDAGLDSALGSLVGAGYRVIPSGVILEEL